MNKKQKEKITSIMTFVVPVIVGIMIGDKLNPLEKIPVLGKFFENQGV